MVLSTARTLFIIFLFSSCSLLPRHHFTELETKSNIERLTQMLLELNISHEEAQDLARESVDYAHSLAEEYRVVSPPLWHNTMVNLGFRERGLCFQWAEDMLLHFLKRGYTTPKFYIVGANIGDYFEHNALAISSKSGELENGIILDAWRYSGDLYFNYIYRDKYRWENRKDIYQKVLDRLEKKGI